jgi:hypothetical protein
MGPKIPFSFFCCVMFPKWRDFHAHKLKVGPYFPTINTPLWDTNPIVPPQFLDRNRLPVP